MARLPVVGGDSGNWGTILNDFLEVSLNQDGTIQPAALTAAGAVTSVNTIAPNQSGSVTLTAANVGAYAKPSGGIPSSDMSSPVQQALTAGASAVQLGGDLGGTNTAPTISKLQGTTVNAASPQANQVLSFVEGQWVPAAVTQTTVNDATSSAPGIIQLDGDLGGTATSPQVTSTHLSSPLPVAQGGTGSATQNFLTLGGDLGNSPTAPKVESIQGVTISGTPSSGQAIIAASSSTAAWSAIPSASNATSSTPGLIQLTGDLAPVPSGSGTPLLRGTQGYPVARGTMSVGVTLPADLEVGDKVLLWCNQASATIPSFSAPGFTAITAAGNGYTVFTAQLLYRSVASSSESGTTVTVTLSGDTTADWSVLMVTLGPNAIFDPVTPSASAGTLSSGMSPTSPSVTTADSGDMLLWFGGCGATSPLPTLTVPPGFALLAQAHTQSVQSTLNNVAVVGMMTQAAAGVVPAEAGTLSIAHSGGALLIAISGSNGTSSLGAYVTDTHLSSALSQSQGGTGSTVPATAFNNITGGHGSKLTGWYTALANRDTARANVCFIGASSVAGQAATSFANTHIQRIQSRLRARFTNTVTGSSGGRGFLTPVTSAYSWSASSYCTVTGTPAVMSNQGVALQGFDISAGSGCTLTYSLVGDSADIIWCGHSSGGSFTWKVDSNSTTTVSTAMSSIADGQITHVSLGTAGAHTLTITWSSGTPVIIDGVVEYDGDYGCGIMVHSCGLYGAWVTVMNSALYAQAVAALNPALIVIEAGANGVPGITTPQWTAELVLFAISDRTCS